MTGLSYTIETSRDESPTLSVQKGENHAIYIHSRYHPVRDSGLLRSAFDPSRFDILVVLGIGLGYHLIPLKDLSRSYSRIILIDILPGLEREISRIESTGFLTALPDVVFLCGLDGDAAVQQATGIIDFDSARGIQVLEHPPSARAFPDYYDRIKAGIDSFIQRKATQRATRKVLGRSFMRNVLLNLAAIPDFYPVRALENCVPGLPAIIVASGPTLNRSLPLLGEKQMNVIIISTDSALPVLLSRGIHPDVFVSIDPQPHLYEHLLDSGAVAVPVYSLNTSNSVLRRRKGFISLSSHPVSQLLDELFPGIFGSIDSGTGTVSGDALRLAHLAGTSVQGFLGQDFSFPGLTIYARGSAYQKRYSQFFQDRFNPVESWNARYVFTSSKGLREGSLHTRKSFLHYRESMEFLIRDTGSSAVLNLNSAGLPLRNAPVLSPGEFFETHCSRSISEEKKLMSSMSPTPLSELIDFKALRSILENGDVFEKLLKASLNDPSPGMSSSMGKLISRL